LKCRTKKYDFQTKIESGGLREISNAYRIRVVNFTDLVIEKNCGGHSVSKGTLQNFGKGRFNLMNPNIVEVTENSGELKSQTGLHH
jgi:hypothetical protein